MTPITPELLAEIKRLDEKATKGPMTIEYPMGDDEHIIVPAGKPTYEWCFVATVTATDDDGRASISEAEALANAQLFALSRTALPALARRVEELEAECERLRDLADSVVFHQLCCLGGCHNSMKSLAELAKAIGFEADPATAEEINAALSASSDIDAPNVAKTHDCYAEEQREWKSRATAALEAARVYALQKYEGPQDDASRRAHAVQMLNAIAESTRAALSSLQPKGTTP